MDFAYMGRILLSSVIFAPGLILLAGALVVGVLMLVEKWGILETLSDNKAIDAVVTADASNKLVGELKESIEAPAAEKTEKREANKNN